MTDEDFFADQEVEDLAQKHAESILALSEKEAKRILTAYKLARSDIRDRLLLIPGDTFTAQQLRSTLVQMDVAIAEISRVLGREMSDSALRASELGVENLLREIRKWDKTFTGASIPLNLDVAVVATDTQNFLINRYESSINNYSQALRSRITFGLTDAALQGVALTEVIDRLERTFAGEQWKLQQIARTELSNIYSTGKLKGMERLAEDEIPDLMKTLFHPMDKRTGEDSKRLAQNNPIVPIDEPFVENSTGKTLTYMAPPNRPNDRSILIPYRKAWKS